MRFIIKTSRDILLKRIGLLFIRNTTCMCVHLCRGSFLAWHDIGFMISLIFITCSVDLKSCICRPVAYALTRGRWNVVMQEWMTCGYCAIFFLTQLHNLFYGECKAKIGKKEIGQMNSIFYTSCMDATSSYIPSIIIYYHYVNMTVQFVS